MNLVLAFVLLTLTLPALATPSPPQPPPISPSPDASDGPSPTPISPARLSGPPHPLAPELASAHARVSLALQRLAAARAALSSALRESAARNETVGRFVDVSLRAREEVESIKKRERDEARAAEDAERTWENAERRRENAEAEAKRGRENAAERRENAAERRENAEKKAQLVSLKEKEKVEAVRKLKEYTTIADGHRQHVTVAEARLEAAMSHQGHISAKVVHYDDEKALKMAKIELEKAEEKLKLAAKALSEAQKRLSKVREEGEAAVKAAEEALSAADKAYKAAHKTLHDYYANLLSVYKTTVKLRKGVSWFHHFNTFYDYYTMKLDKSKDHYCEKAKEHSESANHGAHRHTVRFYKDACERYEIHKKYEPLISRHSKSHYYKSWKLYYAAHQKQRNKYLALYKKYSEYREKDKIAKAALAKAKDELKRVKAKFAADLAKAKKDLDEAEKAHAKAETDHRAAEEVEKEKSAKEAASRDKMEKRLSVYTAANEKYESLLRTCKLSVHCADALKKTEEAVASGLYKHISGRSIDTHSSDPTKNVENSDSTVPTATPAPSPTPITPPAGALDYSSKDDASSTPAAAPAA